MTAIVEERTIEATPGRVFKALTQPDEIVCWWAYEARVQPEVGSLGEFRFRPPAGVLQFEVADWQERETLWYLGGLRIIQALEMQLKQTSPIFEYLEPAGTSTFSYAPSQEDTAFYVIEGETIFVSAEATIHATPGTFLFLPRPVGFRSVVTPSGPARILTWTTPMGFAQQVTCMGNPGQAFVLSPPPLCESEKIQQLATLLRKTTQTM